MPAELPRAWIASIGGIAGAAMTAALLLFFVVEIRDPLAAAPAATADAAKAMRPEVVAVHTMRIVPADVLSTAAQWAPLTGDGSN